MKRFLIILLVVVAVYGAGCLALLYAMCQPPATFGKIMAKIESPVVFMLFPFRRLWFVARGGNLELGDVAPDFTLSEQNSRAPVTLSSFRKARPVVLIFGSYT